MVLIECICGLLAQRPDKLDPSGGVIPFMSVTVRWTATDKGGEARFRPRGYYAWRCNIGQVSILARHDSWEQIPVGLAGVQQRAYTDSTVIS